MIDERIYEQFKEIGRDLYEHQMISSHGGKSCCIPRVHAIPPGER